MSTDRVAQIVAQPVSATSSLNRRPRRRRYSARPRTSCMRSRSKARATKVACDGASKIASRHRSTWRPWPGSRSRRCRAPSPPGASIAEETRAAVLEAARKLNYVPNSIASSLTTKRTNIVALILGNLGESLLRPRAARLQPAGCRTRGGRCWPSPSSPAADSDEAILHVLKYQVDGVILTAAQLSTRMTEHVPRARHPDRAVQPLHPGQRCLRRALRQCGRRPSDRRGVPRRPARGASR